MVGRDENATLSDWSSFLSYFQSIRCSQMSCTVARHVPSFKVQSLIRDCLPCPTSYLLPFLCTCCVFLFAAVLLQPICAFPCLDFHHFLLSYHVSLPLLKKILKKTSLVSVLSILRGIPWPLTHHSPLLLLPTRLPSAHFLVLTSLSIRALRVLCTSSPSLSISAFKCSFCSVSSCTFLSFSCSRSLRLFLADKYDDDVRCMEEAKEDKAPLDLSLVLLLRFPRREDG